MISQEQAVASVSSLTIIVGFILYSLIQTAGFLPYVVEGTPHIGNIMIMVVLVSFLVSGVLVILFSVFVTLFSVVRKKEYKITGLTVLLSQFAAFILIAFALLLHVFHFVAFPLTILSYVVISGIVVYGKYKEKNRLQKYITEGSRGTAGKDSIKV